nr:hypothetical protein CFP56_74352 [Quercus suber]
MNDPCFPWNYHLVEKMDIFYHVLCASASCTGDLFLTSISMSPDHLTNWFSLCEPTDSSLSWPMLAINTQDKSTTPCCSPQMAPIENKEEKTNLFKWINHFFLIQVGPKRPHLYKKCYCSLSFFSVFSLFLLYILVLMSCPFLCKPHFSYTLLILSYLNHPSLPNIPYLKTLVSFCT